MGKEQCDDKYTNTNDGQQRERKKYKTGNKNGVYIVSHLNSNISLLHQI